MSAFFVKCPVKKLLFEVYKLPKKQILTINSEDLTFVFMR